MSRSLRERLGVLALDRPGLEWNLWGGRIPFGGGHWTRIANRRDTIHVGPGGRGADCEGRWTSRIHACSVFPSLGRRLLARALGEWPLGSESRPDGHAADPEVSFVIGHRGLDRLPHLSLVLRAIAAQRGAGVECVVVEQSEVPEIADHVPGWVRYLHTPIPAGMPYSRGWAFNVGARAASGRMLAFHDNDMLVPRCYAAEILARRAEGYEVLNLKRFIFYLGEIETGRVLQGAEVTGPPSHVVQNLEGGGSVAIDREAFFAIGGFDEAFVGWGGEDNEFWERAQVRTVWRWGYLPLVHLHHADQPEKGQRDRETATLLDLRSAVPPLERARELAGRAFGRLEGPDPPFPPREDPLP